MIKHNHPNTRLKVIDDRNFNLLQINRRLWDYESTDFRSWFSDVVTILLPIPQEIQIYTNLRTWFYKYCTRLKTVLASAELAIWHTHGHSRNNNNHTTLFISWWRGVFVPTQQVSNQNYGWRAVVTGIEYVITLVHYCYPVCYPRLYIHSCKFQVSCSKLF